MSRTETVPIPSSGDVTPPDYSLSPEQLNLLEQELVAEIRLLSPTPGVSSVWISPENKYANFIRNHESSYFPEVQDISSEEEVNTTFLALVDTRYGVNRVTHGATITGTGDVLPAEAYTGFYTVDTLIDLGNFSLQDFEGYYQRKGIDLTKCLAVETNFKIGAKPEAFEGLGSADLLYVSIFRYLKDRSGPIGTCGVFATCNELQRASFERVGIPFELLMGHDGMSTPEEALGIDSLPIFIPLDTQVDGILGVIDVKMQCITL